MAGPDPDDRPATESTEPDVGFSRDSAHSVARRRGGRLAGYVRLMRPGNATMAALGGLAGLWLAGGTTGQLADLPLVLAATLPPLFVAAFGNVVNDLRDLELDRSAHPTRPLPSGQVGKREAWTLAGLLLVTGLAWTQDAGFPAFALAGLNALLLGLYEARLKAAGLPGNVLVGLLVGSTFVYGGVVAHGAFPREPMLLLLACLAALTNTARELLKDLEDRAADAGHRRTFPLTVGPGATRLLAFALVNAAVLATFVAWLEGPADWWWPWLIGLAVADVAFLAAASLAWMDEGLAQRGLKLAMLLALVSFLAGPAVGDIGLR